MELSPESVATTSFRSVKKGYDPNEVRSYLENLSKSIESLQSHATAMEVRARAAVSRLQEIANQTQPEPAAAPAGPLVGSFDESETISRTLLLAQRTADAAIAEANADAQRITEDANAQCRALIDGAQEASSRMVEEAKVEARRSGEQQRVQIDGEVQALLARREFLSSDVDHLELHIITQRDRIRDVATSLTDLVSDVQGGLGDIRRPLVSAVVADVPSADGSDDTSADADTAGTADTADTPESDPAVAPLPISEPVTLTPIDEPDSDPAPPPSTADAPNSEGAGDTAPDTGASTDETDSTPPAGQPDRFLFEDVTAEIARTTPPLAEGQMTIGGEELR